MTTTEQALPRYPFSTRGDRLADELRGTCPVTRVTTNAGHEAWLVTGYPEARRVLREERFRRARVADEGSPVQDAPVFAPELLDAMAYLGRAGLLEEARRLLGELPDLPEEELRAEARRGLEEMVARGAPGDLQHHFAERVAGLAMCRVMGLPTADLPRLRHWADTDLTMLLPTEEVHRNWEQLRDHLLERGRNGGAGGRGLVPRLAAMNTGSDALTPHQLANVLGVVFVAGYEDLASFLGGAAFHLARMPGVLAGIRTDPGSVEGHVEELLRYSVLMGNALARICTDDTEVGGRRLRTGDLVLVSADAANYDPATFPDPDSYDPSRRPNPHMRFGHGPHYCPGARLTRRVGALALTELARLEGLRLAVPPQDVEWHPDRMAIMPAAVPVLW
ncbi:cytochrome P450 [Nocardiopsis sp. CA-288880]|uniref:cytochrome P450 n=1 Tax=Nocardiopsis sp. CA-288880 TaxID=3239995 RepID=UPI003D99E55A